MKKEHKTIMIAGAVAVIITAAVFWFYRFNAPRGRGEISDFRFPVLPPDEFNILLADKLGKGSLTWKDANNDKTFILRNGSIDIRELSGGKLKDFTIKSGGFHYFNRSFESIYGSILETIRRKRVSSELNLTVLEPMVTDVIVSLKQHDGVTVEEISTYRNGIQKLLEIAPIMQELYQRQIGASREDRILAATDDDRELIDRYGHPWCLSDSSDFCVAVPTFKKRVSGVIPAGVSCKDANEIGSPFEVVVRDKDGSLKAIPYNTVWSTELTQAAERAREAAEIFEKIPREAAFAKYLKDLSDAFVSTEPYPYAASDLSWNEALVSDSLLFARIGPDEVGGDSVGDACESKARFHFNLGIKNNSVGNIVTGLKPEIQRLENLFASLIDDPANYQPREVAVHLPIFLDVIYANGDDVGGPGGTPIGQTLPNWCGTDGKGECMRGTMIYLNKTLKSYSEKLMNKYIMPLFDEGLRGKFSEDANVMSVVYHELFHNLGPMYKLPKPGGGATYGDTLVASSGESWKVPIEELKAQTGAMYMATVFFEDAKVRFAAGEIDGSAYKQAEEKYHGEIMRDLAWCLRMIMRASRENMEFTTRNPYARLAAVQIGFFTQHGAISFNPKSGTWSVNFEKMPTAVIALMKRTGELYAKADANQIEEFFLYYMRGEGEKLLHRDRILEVAGAMPTTLFNYQLKGL